MNPMIWFVILCLAAFFLLSLEVFLPDLVLGIVGVLCLVGACVMAFQAFEPATAMLVSVVLVTVTLAGFFVWLVKMPDSRVGQRISLSTDLHESKSSVDESPLLGKRGVAETDLRPGGFVRVEGQKLDVVCNRGYVETGSGVEIIEARGNHIVVREIQGEAT